MQQLKLLLAGVTSHALAASLNNTLTEQGIGLMYNSHLEGWSEADPKNGTPVIQGYLTVKSPGAGFPTWSSDNTLRICMQIWDMKKPNTVEQIRYVLNYTFPTLAANYTPQMHILQQTTNEAPPVTDWCAKKVSWSKIIIDPKFEEARKK